MRLLPLLGPDGSLQISHYMLHINRELLDSAEETYMTTPRIWSTQFRAYADSDLLENSVGHPTNVSEAIRARTDISLLATSSTINYQ